MDKERAVRPFSNSSDLRGFDGCERLAAVAGQWQTAGPVAAGILSTFFQVALIVFHVICVVHVLRRGQDYWWILLILLFPPIGGLAYAIVVMLPEWRQQQRLHTPARERDPQRRVHKLERMVELADTVDNRAELADAYCDNGEYTKARETYEECMEGMYEDDSHLLFGLARACYGEGKYQQTLDALNRIGSGDAPEYAGERALLRSKAMIALGRDDEAIDILREFAPKVSSMEAWWRLATLLAKRGDDEEADEVCRRIVTNSEQMNPVFRRREKEWINHARERLKNRQ